MTWGYYPHPFSPFLQITCCYRRKRLIDNTLCLWKYVLCCINSVHAVAKDSHRFLPHTEWLERKTVYIWARSCGYHWFPWLFLREGHQMQDRQHRIDIVSIHAYNITSYAEQPPTSPPMDELGMFRFQCSLGDVDYTTGSHHDVAKTLCW